MIQKLFAFTLSSFLISAALSEKVSAQVNFSCRKVYSNDAIEKSKSFISLESLRPNSEIKELDSAIKDVESSLSSYRRTTLEKEASGKFEIFYSDKSRDQLESEHRRRTEMNAIEREEEELSEKQTELADALKYLAKAKTPATAAHGKDKALNDNGDLIPGFLKSGIDKLFENKKWERKWTQSQVDTLTQRIAFLIKNISIRSKNVDVYNSDIKIYEAQSKENMQKKALVELAELNKKDSARKQELEALKEKKEKAMLKLETEAHIVMSNALKDSRLVSPITDLISFYTLKNLPKENKVTVLAGNLLSGSNRIEYHQANALKELVTKLVEKKYYVVFDAESTYAPYISQLAGTFGIPVMAREQIKFADHKNKMIINNDYLRMQVLADSKAVISTPDSVTGIGMFTEGLVNYMLDPTGTFETASLKKWTADLNDRDRNLGVTAKSVTTFSSANDIINDGLEFNSLRKAVTNIKPFSIFKPNGLSVDSTKKVLEEAISFAQVMEKNTDTGGSVIFGSSQKDRHSAKLIYETAYQLGRMGIAVATGGSGGAMEIANSGAWNSGGPSIGIPIGGKHTLDTEKDFASSTHSKTIMTAGYQERIPALLGEGLDSRKMIIFAPGGNGTIKELATTLVRASGKFWSFKKIVFLDSDYYGPLVQWIMNSSLPKALKDKIVMADTVAQLEALALPLQEASEKARIKTPRKDQPNYENPFEAKKYSDDNEYDSPSRFKGSSSGIKSPVKSSGNKRSKGTSYKSSYKSSGDTGKSASSGTTKSTTSNSTNTKKEFKTADEEQQYYHDLYSDFYNGGD